MSGIGSSWRAIRSRHAWLRNSDRSVRLPRLIGTACPPYHIVVRNKEKEWLEGKRKGYLLLLIVVSTCVWFPANLEVIADLLNWMLKFESKDPLLSRCFGKTNPEPASHGLGVGTFLFAVLVG